MLKSLIYTEIFNKLQQDVVTPSHAYLMYGEDGLLNIELARVFIASIFCGKMACFECESCKRIEINKNPDLLIIDKPNLQVSDIEGLIDNVQLKPMIYKYKVIFITNADGINVAAQNKLLKTLEEPNSQVVFVLACTNSEKLLPTIKSRLKKHYIPSIDLGTVAQDLKMKGVNIDKFLHCGVTLTDAVKYAEMNNNNIITQVEESLIKLKSSADIANVVSGLKLQTEQRREYLKLLLNALNCALSGGKDVFSEQFIEYLQQQFNAKVLIKALKLIDESSRMLEANVNFNYILDRLFYNILKEKYLCK
ncbi:MAG: AAA family ATPase [Clostridia bacterium]|nr:AAA family ATPase [Clostridia bacterium]